MAHKKAGGSTKNGRDSNPQYRGIKVYGGQSVTAGSVLLRQVGGTFKQGVHVDGTVKYETIAGNRKRVSVHPHA